MENPFSFFVSSTGESIRGGGGGESTSNSDELDLDRDLRLEREWLLLRDRATLKLDTGESQLIGFEWYVLLLSSSSSDSSGFTSRRTPNLISSERKKNKVEANFPDGKCIENCISPPQNHFILH